MDIHRVALIHVRGSEERAENQKWGLVGQVPSGGRDLLGVCKGNAGYRLWI